MTARFAACECGRSARSMASLPAYIIDVVIFNCVINLSVAKPAVLTETYCVLAPGGRIGISRRHRRRRPHHEGTRRMRAPTPARSPKPSPNTTPTRPPPASPSSKSCQPTKSPTACIPRSSAPSNPPPRPNRHPPRRQLAGPMCTLGVSAGCWQGPPLAEVQQVQPVQQPSVVKGGVQRVTALGEVRPPLEVQRHDVPGA